MIAFITALIIGSTPVPVETETSTTSRVLEPYEVKLTKSAATCLKEWRDTKAELKECYKNLAGANERLTKTEEALIEAPPLDEEPSSSRSRWLHILVPAGASALGGTVSALVCEKSVGDAPTSALTIGASAGLAALLSTIVLELLE